MSGSGLFIAVVGPSGAGKDTLLLRAKSVLPSAQFIFPSRIISRPGDDSEASIFLPASEFPAARLRGDFLVDWEAHGLCYAIPSSAAAMLAEGRHVIANLSRGALPTLRSLTPRVFVAHVTARPDILARRLLARGREVDADRQARLQRSATMDHALEADIRIENNGAIDEAVETFVSALIRIAGEGRKLA